MPRPPRPRDERRRPKSQTNRLSWKPRDPHGLDVLKEEQQVLDQLISERLTSTSALLQSPQVRLLALLTAQNLSLESFENVDRAATQQVHARFWNRKHRAHLQAFFALPRRQRLLGQLQAIEAALHLVSGLLALLMFPFSLPTRVSLCS